MTKTTRRLALGGVIGPAVFVGSWMVAGAVTEGYSPVHDAISDLAAIGAPTRVLMTTGLVVDGLGILAFGLALREELDGPAWIAAVGTGLGTLGVAASPLGGWTGDGVHAAFAGFAYLSTTALPLLAARTFARSGRPRATRASIATGAVSAAALLASTTGPGHGLFQRLGLTAGDVWIVTAAVGILAGRMGSRRRS